MKLCKRTEIEELRAANELNIHTNENDTDDEIRYLDEYRIGLRVEALIKLSGTVDLGRSIQAPFTHLEIETSTLEPGSFYLATTRERVRLGANYFGSVHTRSKYARVGFETLTSSNFLVPGFGSTGPAPIVLEITTKLPTSGLSRDHAYCFMLIYQGSDFRIENTRDYLNRYPMNHLSGDHKEETDGGER